MHNFIFGHKKKFLKSLILLLGLVLLSTSLSAQSKNKNWRLSGYVKDMQLLTYYPSLEQTLTGNFLHNRLNFRWYPHKNWSVGVEQRSRLFMGQMYAASTFAEDLGIDPGFIDLSFVLMEKDQIVLHTITDRAWVGYSHKKFDIRIGRQRINWGINTVWNPNDIFNAFNYLDFDYEERPGTDGIRAQYYPNSNMTIEVASNIADNLDDYTAAALVKFNKWKYDIQFMGGVFEHDIVAGGGWAGNIKSAGFKGEFAYFFPYENDINNSQNGMSATLSIDYTFKKPVYIMGSFMYNKLGTDQKFQLNDLTEFGDISAKNLSPAKYSLFTSVNWSPSPITGLSLSNIYSPGPNMFIIIPTFSYSITESWDIYLIAQLYYFEADKFERFSDNYFLRLKWSFGN